MDKPYSCSEPVIIKNIKVLQGNSTNTLYAGIFLQLFPSLLFFLHVNLMKKKHLENEPNTSFTDQGRMQIGRKHQDFRTRQSMKGKLPSWPTMTRWPFKIQLQCARRMKAMTTTERMMSQMTTQEMKKSLCDYWYIISPSHPNQLHL